MNILTLEEHRCYARIHGTQGPKVVLGAFLFACTADFVYWYGQMDGLRLIWHRITVSFSCKDFKLRKKVNLKLRFLIFGNGLNLIEIRRAFGKESHKQTFRYCQVTFID